MIKNKLESLSGSKFRAFKLGGVIPNKNDDSNPIGLQIPISGGGTYNGSGFSYNGEISTCSGTGNTSVSLGGGIISFNVSNAKDYMYDCDWWAQVTYDGYTRTFHGN